MVALKWLPSIYTVVVEEIKRKYFETTVVPRGWGGSFRLPPGCFTVE